MQHRAQVYCNCMYISVFVCVSYHINEMPVVLIFGIATTIDSVHQSLPHRVTSLLSMERFQAPSSSDYLSMVLHQVSNSAWHKFCLYYLNKSLYGDSTDKLTNVSRTWTGDVGMYHIGIYRSTGLWSSGI